MKTYIINNSGTTRATLLSSLFVLLFSLLLMGCYRVDIYTTEHPGQGKLTITTDWTNRTDGIAIPTEYTAESAGQKVTLSGTTAEYPNLLEPGSHTLRLYNTADKITVNGSTLTAQNDPLLGFQFFAEHTEMIEKDKDHAATVSMRQITKQLEIELTLSGSYDHIAGITATLSGIAGAWDCANSQPTGTAITTTPTFTVNGNIASAVLRLLGTSGQRQLLTITATYDGTTQTSVTEIDLSNQLSAFNLNKTTIGRLTGTADAMTYAELQGSIEDWQVTDNGELATLSYKLGDYYPDPNVTFNDDKTVRSGTAPIGVVFYLDNPVDGFSLHGKIVSLQEGNEKWCEWAGYYEATSETDGRANTDVIATIVAGGGWAPFPAYQWCVDRGAGWYFPAKEELMTLSAEYGKSPDDFDNRLTAAGGKEIIGGHYWSSTMVIGKNILAHVVYIRSNVVDWYNISATLPVRAVYAF